MVLADGDHYDFATKPIPQSWIESPDGLPQGATWTFQYVCAPENVSMATRHRFAEKYGAWLCPSSGLSSKDVMWWSDLNNTPDLVITFLDFVISDFKDVFAFFTYIDGGSCGNGQISCTEFQIGMKALNWPQLSCDESTKFLFRYFDRDMSGDISVAEWAHAHQLWKEMQLTIFEFLQYLNRTFEGDFGLAWKQIDADGDGLVDHKEWAAGVKSVGFFGASDAIFKYVVTGEICGKMFFERWQRRIVSLWKHRTEVMAIWQPDLVKPA